MLILTRRIGESVYIGDEVRMTVLGVRGTQVRIGINAPKDVPVHREEIYHKIKHEQALGGSSRGNRYEPDGNVGQAYGVAEGDDAPYSEDEPDPNNA